MKTFKLCIFALLLTSCSYLNQKKYVEGNVFYSEHSPKIQIEVNKSMGYVGENKDMRENPVEYNAGGSGPDGFSTSYLFMNSEKKIFLELSFENIGLTIPGRYFVIPPDFSGKKGFIKTGKQNIDNTCFFMELKQ